MKKVVLGLMFIRDTLSVLLEGTQLIVKVHTIVPGVALSVTFTVPGKLLNTAAETGISEKALVP